jgi:DNA replication protein DnaC
VSDDETDNEPTERDDADTPAAADNYARTEGAQSVSDAVKNLNDLLGLNDVDFTKRDEAWWAEMDQRCKTLDAQRAVAAELDRMRKRAEDLVKRGGFPRVCVDAALNPTIETPAIGFARRFPHLPSRILVLSGGTGAGKTTAACWLALKGHDHTPGFIRASELERRGRYDKKLDEWLRDISSLVIDDLGVEVLDSKRVFASLLDEIVDSFYNRRRTLILTTNLLPRVDDETAAEAKRRGEDPPPQFVERYGERVRSRVRQVGQWADCGMYDLRRPTVPQA